MRVIKKIGLIIGLSMILYIGWLNLPVSVNRYSDIKLGNKIIDQIEAYKKTNGLPESNDWEILKRLGFKDKGEFLEPEYQKLNNANYQLIFIQGFDGPYLLWTSKDKKWKIDQPLFPDDWINKNNNANTIKINCDSVYNCKNFDIELKPLNAETDNESENRFEFCLLKTINGQLVKIYNDTIFSTTQEITFKDYNNDKTKDILIQNSSDARSNWTYNLYLVNLKNDSLIKVKGFNEIKNPRFLKEYNLIDNYVNSGKNWTNFYKLQGDTILDLGYLIYDDQTEDGNYKIEYIKAIEEIKKK